MFNKSEYIDPTRKYIFWFFIKATVKIDENYKKVKDTFEIFEFVSKSILVDHLIFLFIQKTYVNFISYANVTSYSLSEKDSIQNLFVVLLIL